jgi:hypothetical protein
MTRSRPGPDPDRLLVARLDGIAQRHARWGAATEDELAAGTAELRAIAGARADLLAEVAGLALGTAESRGQEYVARGQAVAELCVAAGADEALIGQWVEEGRRRAEAARRPPFSGGVRPLGCLRVSWRAVPAVTMTSRLSYPAANLHLSCMFDSGTMAHDRPAPDRDRLLVARLAGIALRHVWWGALTEDEKAAGAAELRKIAGGRADLLAEVAGIALGAAEGKAPERQAQAQAIVELCRRAGADENLIPQWIEEGRRRA